MWCFIEDFRMCQTLTWWNPACTLLAIWCSKPHWPSLGEVSQLPVLDDGFGLPIEAPCTGQGEIRPPFWLQPGAWELIQPADGPWLRMEKVLGFGLFGDFVSQPGRICGRYVVVGKKCFSAEISTKTGSAMEQHYWRRSSTSGQLSHTLCQVYERIWGFPKSWGYPQIIQSLDIIWPFLYWNPLFLGSTIRLRNPHIARLPFEPLVSVVKHGNGTPPIRRLWPYLNLENSGISPCLVWLPEGTLFQDPTRLGYPCSSVPIIDSLDWFKEGFTGSPGFYHVFTWILHPNLGLSGPFSCLFWAKKSRPRRLASLLGRWSKVWIQPTSSLDLRDPRLRDCQEVAGFCPSSLAQLVLEVGSLGFMV